VAASNKLRWKRLLNELKFLYAEKELVDSISEESAREFEIYYEQFCAHHDLHQKELNQKHSKRIQEIYSEKTIADQCVPLLAGLPVLYEDTQSDKESEPYIMTKDEIEVYEAFKRVFRKLALLLHPDKIDPTLSATERQEKLRMFKEAKAALESHQYFKLLELAELFKISAPRNYKQQSRWMKREVARLEEEIVREKKTYNYQFAECETDAQKDRLVASFIYQVFGLKLSYK
jgi:hypothetical protein